MRRCAVVGAAIALAALVAAGCSVDCEICCEVTGVSGTESCETIEGVSKDECSSCDFADIVDGIWTDPTNCSCEEE